MTTLGTAPVPEVSSTATASAGESKRASWPTRIIRWRGKGGLAAILLALPGVFVFTYFAWFPLARALVLSFQQTNFVTAPTWVGWANFQFVLSDPLLWTALRNTLYFVVLSILIGFPLPLFLAVYMAELRRRRAWFTVLSYIPTVVPPVAGILLWRTMLDPSATGTLNAILGWFGIGPLPWLNSPVMAMPTIVLYSTWASFGGTVIIYLAALVGVRAELYEAAELDGAGIWQRVWHVTLPQLRGIIFVLLLLQIIGTTQVFTEPYVFTRGGPDNATLTILMLIFQYAFGQYDYGSATALSVLLAIFLGIVSVAYNLVTRRASQS